MVTERQKEQNRERARRWRKVNPLTAEQKERARLRMQAWRKASRPSRHHGRTRVEVMALLAAQGGTCAVCSESSDRWHLDHDHVTGHKRGVLCHGCNVGIGLLKDDPARCRAAADYLARHAVLQTLL